jgi:ArsR family transcriptional regulator, arsenate/arsenite/antimonite-responsive transcriptional repressor
MTRKEKFDPELQKLALFAKALSHPARLAILKYLAESQSCISGDISDQLPLSRSTVSQHLKELRDMGMIHGEIDGLKINYCLCLSKIEELTERFDIFFETVKAGSLKCEVH